MSNPFLKYIDRVEDKLRAKLSRKPILYAFIGSIGVVLIWRGVWMIADSLKIPGWLSLLLGVSLTIFTGLFVSFFIGDRIIISGIKEEKRIDEKTEEEIRKEDNILKEIEKDVDKIKKDIEEEILNKKS